MTQLLSSSRARKRSRGFTFLEVLFSVIIVGVGFIMIAAIFPVAIQQGQSTLAETIGQNIGRDALRYVQSAASDSLMITTDDSTGAHHFVPLPQSLVSAGNNVGTGDPRFGWIGFYRRDLDPNTNIPQPYAQIIIIVGQNRVSGQTSFSAPAYTSGTLGAGPPVRYTTVPAYGNNTTTASIAYTSAGSTINFGAISGSNPLNDNAFAVVLAAPSNNNMLGRVVRLGSNLYYNDATNGYQWNLTPGAIGSSADNVSGASVFVLGSPLDPTLGIYSGLSQDVVALSGTVRINQ